MQWFFDAWGRLDWPNLVMGAIVAGTFWLLTTKVGYPLLIKSQESSKLYLHKRQKAAILRDYRLIAKFKKRDQEIVVWCLTKVVTMFMSSMIMLGLIVLLSGLGGNPKAVLEIYPVWPGGETRLSS